MTPALEASCRGAVHIRQKDGSYLRAGRAALFLLEQVGVPRWLCWLGRLPPFIWGIELGYWLVARYRGKLYRYVFRRFDPLRDQPMSER